MHDIQRTVAKVLQTVGTVHQVVEDWVPLTLTASCCGHRVRLHFACSMLLLAWSQSHVCTHSDQEEGPWRRLDHEAINSQQLPWDPHSAGVVVFVRNCYQTRRSPTSQCRNVLGWSRLSSDLHAVRQTAHLCGQWSLLANGRCSLLTSITLQWANAPTLLLIS